MSGSQSGSRHSAGTKATVRGRSGGKAPAEKVSGSKAASPGSQDSGASNGAGAATHAVPRWRQIEILRERRALQEALDEFGDLDVELSDDIFGGGPEDPAWFRVPGEADDESDDADPGDGDDVDDLDDEPYDQDLD
jgi:hypothetical protein